jgi:hypothetical protein
LITNIAKNRENEKLRRFRTGDVEFLPGAFLDRPRSEKIDGALKTIYHSFFFAKQEDGIEDLSFDTALYLFSKSFV